MKVARSYEVVTSETKVVNGKTVTKTKKEAWGDNVEAPNSLTKDMDDMFEAVGRVMDKIGKSSNADKDSKGAPTQ
jgi:hypothetical protein